MHDLAEKRIGYIPDAREISARIQIRSRVPSICIPALAGRSPRKVSNSRSVGMPRISTCLEDSEFAHAWRFRSRGRARSTRRPPADGPNWNISDLTAFTSNISLIAKVCVKFHDGAKFRPVKFYKSNARYEENSVNYRRSLTIFLKEIPASYYCHYGCQGRGWQIWNF
ncbi:hypothetical protein QLX08_010328 [Tetragonisca angustula]|uniref:Uncharacterized protein n=1 Tax=Tetragonisca angustula TaxID=166442 RepID=A0AAW0ZDV6_9HYME